MAASKGVSPILRKISDFFCEWKPYSPRLQFGAASALKFGRPLAASAEKYPNIILNLIAPTYFYFPPINFRPT